MGFYADRDSGIYRIGADNWGFATGGALTADMTTTAFRLAAGKILAVDHIAEATGSHGIVHDHVILLPDGTKTIPALGFTGNTDLGIYRFGDLLRVSINDTDTLEVGSKYAAVIGTAADNTSTYFKIHNTQAQAADVGSMLVFTTTSLTMARMIGAWEHATNQDSYLAWHTKSSTTVAEKWRIASAGHLRANQDGTAALPVLSWIADPDSGIYRIGANNFGLAVNGALVADVNTAGLNLASGMVLEVNATQVVGAQQAAPDAPLTALTATAPSTPDYAIADLVLGGWGFQGHDEGNTVLKVLIAVQKVQKDLIVLLQNHGLIGVYPP
jgi:hypothetical protein